MACVPGSASPPLSSPGRPKESPLSLAELHEVWAWVIVVTNAIAGGWALAAHWRPGLRSPWLWRFTAAAEVAIVAQVVLGVVLVQRGRVAPEFHLFYGFVALASIGIIYSYRQQLEPWRHLLYGFGSLFLMGLALRAVFLTDAATTTIG